MLALLLAGTGCAEDADLIVATPWTPARCLEFEGRLEPEFAAPGFSGGAPSIHWVRLPPWEDPGRVLERGARIDALLGWPASVYHALQEAGALPSGNEAIRSVSLGAMAETSGPEAIEGRLSLADGDPRIGASETTTEAAIPGEPPEALDASIVLAWTSSGADRTDSLGNILTDRPTDSTPSTDETSRRVDRFTRAMIGAVVIDGGWTLDGPGASTAAQRFDDLDEAPPWPPETVAALRSEAGGDALLGTLIEALTDDPDGREWLGAQWRRPRRPIDRGLIERLAAVGGGRLIDDPRFNALLRADWTDWARHRSVREPRSSRAVVP